MRHRWLLLALCLAPLAPAHADQAVVARVQAYLNGIATLKARFQQVAPDGTITSGEAWLWRPGRMRFQYDAPSPLLLVAGGGQVIFRDNQLDQTSTIPLANTPLGILLAPRVDLAEGSVTVSDVHEAAGEIDLTLARAGKPGEGTLTLTLDDAPLELRSWVVTDAQHQQTKVGLSGIDTGAAGFDPALFTYRDPNLSAAPQ